MQELARSRGGYLITTEEEFNILIRDNKPSQVYVEWWCGKEDHLSWCAKPNWIQSGAWCPYCAEGKSEKICRRYFEEIFNESFPRIMIRRIIPTYQGRMHFDGYAEIYISGVLFRIAFEYNGRQHYEFPNHIHKNRAEFQLQQQNDDLKKDLCRDNGIILIEIPYNVDPRMNHPSKIREYIKKQFEAKTGIKL